MASGRISYMQKNATVTSCEMPHIEERCRLRPNPKLKAFDVLACTDLAGSGGAGAVLPVAGQHVGCLVDQDLAHIL